MMLLFTTIPASATTATPVRMVLKVLPVIIRPSSAKWDTAGNAHMETRCTVALTERIVSYLQQRYYSSYAMGSYLS